MRPIVVAVVTIHSLSLGKDSWFGADKAKHFFLGAFVQSVAFSGMRGFEVPKTPSLVVASAVSVGAATAKELWDARHHGDPGIKDAVVTIVGAAAISPALARTK